MQPLGRAEHHRRERKRGPGRGHRLRVQIAPADFLEELLKPPHAQHGLRDAALLQQPPQRRVDVRIGFQQRIRRLKAHPGAGVREGVLLRTAKVKQRIVRVAQQQIITGIHQSSPYYLAGPLQPASAVTIVSQIGGV